MKLNKKVVQDAEKHAKECFPQEACGLIIVRKGRRVYIPCKNTASENMDQFAISPEEYAKAEDQGEVVALFHSHPNASANPSEADLVACEASGLVWYILGLPSGVWRQIKPSGYIAPLVGREFYHGSLDCYTLIRDWYQQERGIALLDFEREDGWWERGENLYLEGFPKAGFEVVSGPMKEGDVLLMQIYANVPNHAAVYIGNDQILHHLYGRLSSREIYGGYYKKHTTHVLRYVKNDA